MPHILRFLIPFFVAASPALWGAGTECMTPNGATVPDGLVSAHATFTTGSGFITITLENKLADPTSAGQLLSGLAFALNTGQTTGTLGTNTANIRSVAADRSFTDFGPSGTGWALAQNFNNGLELCVLCTDLGALGPTHLLLGEPDTVSGTYASANRSIAGNGPHNPFTADTATFLVNVPGVTSNSVVTGVTFYFSTTVGVGVTAACGGGGPAA